MAGPEPLTTPDRVRAVPGAPGLSDAALTEPIAKASAQFRSATGQRITAMLDDVVTLDANGSWALLLPELPVRAVKSVIVDGVLLTERDYEWSERGILRRCGRWPARYRSVVVVYDHGFEQVPDDVSFAVAEAVVAGLTVRPGVASVQLGATSYTFARSGTTQAWVDTVARYRVRRR